MSDQVLFELIDGVAEITLANEQKHNAITGKMRDQLYELLARVELDSQVKVVLLKGNGKSFCSGSNVGAMGESTVINTREKMVLFNKIIQKIYKMEKPVISAVQGYAVGAGCAIALASDFIIATRNASFGFPFTTIGLVPDCGSTYFLPRLVGLPKTKEWLFDAAKISAIEAEQRGMINKVVENDSLLTEARAFAEKVKNGPYQAFSMIKTIVNRSLHLELDDVLELERFAQSIAQQTNDHKEGVAAFMGKRTPKFHGN